jgi:L-lactate dehydrogenase complex protein LldG
VTAREEMLRRLRAALGPSPTVPPVPRDYRRAGREAAGSAALVEVFCERIADYRATVARASPAGLDAAIAAACAARGSRRLAAPAAAPWSPPGIELLADDPPLAGSALDTVDGALTGCALAIAETGSIVLDGGAPSGRRALTLVPDHHVCVVHAEQVVAGVPEAVAALAGAACAGRPITFVSGPSATSDIELERVEGVHGPRRLDVVVVD